MGELDPFTVFAGSRGVHQALFNLEIVPQTVIGTIVNSAKVAAGTISYARVEAFVSELYGCLAEGGILPSPAKMGERWSQSWSR